MPAAVNQTDPLQVDGARSGLSGLICALWPPRCLVCGEDGRAREDLCRACADVLRWNHCACLRCAMPLPRPAPACGACLQRGHRLALGETRAACVYAFPVDRLLPRFKFHQDLAAGRLLASLMLQAFSGLPRPGALVPIPLHRARLRSRGYDQALELARPLARALAVPLRDTLLQRRRATAPQSRLDAGARRRNLRGAFSVRDTSTLPDHVVLVDDVMTTGATLQAAAKALRRAGVQRVDAWVCARVP